jgi:hypothetical protein
MTDKPANDTKAPEQKPLTHEELKKVYNERLVRESMCIQILKGAPPLQILGAATQLLKDFGGLEGRILEQGVTAVVASYFSERDRVPKLIKPS